MKIRVIVATLGERSSLSDTLLSINNQSIAGIEVKIVCPQKQSSIVQHIAQKTLQPKFEISESGDFEYFTWVVLNFSSIVISLKIPIYRMHKAYCSH